MSTYTPQAIFDNVERLKSNSSLDHISKSLDRDYQYAKQFLLNYQHNAETFKNFRREIERFTQYCWFVAKKCMCDMRRVDIEAYLLFGFVA